MNRFDIVGLSLAEISLVLVFILLAVFAPAYSRVSREAKAKTHDIEVLHAKLMELQKQVDESASLIKRFGAERPNLRSIATPSCFELNKTSSRWLGTVIVRGVNNYELDGQELSLNDLVSQFSHEIAQGTRDACRFSIKVSSSEGVSGVEFQSALMQLGQTFYLTQSVVH
jgi:hypothetical protein